MMRLLRTAAVTGLSALAATSAAAQDTPANVVVTIGMIGDVVSNVGGECTEVTAIMGPGVDPHLYEATPSDVTSFQNADAIFYSGYSLEGQLGTVLERFGQRTPTVALAPASIDPGQLITVQDIYGIDPHIWMDAALWSKIVPTITQVLIEVRPDCESQFQSNGETYQNQLQALDGWVEEAIASIPEDQRTLVTAHDAFAYFGRAYDIDVAGIQGISTEAEASVADVRATAQTVAETGVPAIFIETTINPRTIQSVVEAARQQGQDVAIGGELYSDAMGEDGTAAGTYIGMIHANTVTITEALGGTVPDLPEALSDWAAQWDIGSGQ